MRTGSEEEFEEQERSGDDPVDVSRVVNSPRRSSNSSRNSISAQSSRSNVTDRNRDTTQVRSHRKVRNSCDLRSRRQRPAAGKGNLKFTRQITPAREEKARSPFGRRDP